MLKKLLSAVALICCLLFVFGCGNGQPAPGDEDTISIEVVNLTEDIIISFAVFFGSENDEWGQDYLGDDVIEPGESYIFVLPEDTYNVSFLTFEHFVIENLSGIDKDIKIEIGGEGLIPVLIENNSDMDILGLFISLSGNKRWGEDLLGEDAYIPAEIGRRFFFVEPDIYDLLAIDIEGEVAFALQGMNIDSERLITID
ncbi:MAG: hypothetical protein ACNA7Z_07570 [Dethiobacteria bacterium]